MGDLIGALAGYIGGKDARVTGQIAALPVYKGKLEKPPEKKPKGELTEKQKQLNAYLAKYQSGDQDGGGAEEEKSKKKKKRKVRRGEEPGRGLKIIDEDKGMGGIALAKAKGALRCVRHTGMLATLPRLHRPNTTGNRAVDTRVFASKHRDASASLTRP